MLRDDDLGAETAYTMYIWNGNAGNYGSFISNGTGGTNGVTQYIPPMQGFFVMASIVGTLQMTEDICVHSGSGNWLKNTNEKVNLFKLKVTSNDNYGSDEAIIEVGNPEASGGAPKMFSFVETAPSLYLPKDGKDYSISFLNTIENNDIIPVNFIAGATGNYTLNFEFAAEFYEGVKLEDTQTGIKYDLLQNQNYSFTANENDEANRFLLHFGPVGINDQPTSQSNIQAWSANKTIHILNPENRKGEIRVLNLFGQEVAQARLTGDTKQEIQLNVPAGYYLVNVISDKEVATRKVVVE